MRIESEKNGAWAWEWEVAKAQNPVCLFLRRLERKLLKMSNRPYSGVSALVGQLLWNYLLSQLWVG